MTQLKRSRMIHQTTLTYQEEEEEEEEEEKVVRRAGMKAMNSGVSARPWTLSGILQVDKTSRTHSKCGKLRGSPFVWPVLNRFNPP